METSAQATGLKTLNIEGLRLYQATPRVMTLPLVWHPGAHRRHAQGRPARAGGHRGRLHLGLGLSLVERRAGPVGAVRERRQPAGRVIYWADVPLPGRIVINGVAEVAER